MSYIKKGIIVFLILILGLFTYILSQHPSNDREWARGHEQLPLISINEQEGSVRIENFRNFHWSDDPAQETAEYTTKEFQLADITGVEVLFSRFLPWESMAHTFVNFTLEGGDNVSISVEARRESDESFSIFAGLLSQYELIYTVTSIEDALSLRILHHHEDVYRYPTIATADDAQRLFVSLSQEVNSLHEKPLFYNLISRNCTNTVAGNVEELTDLHIPTLYTTFAPGFLDRMLFKKGVIADPESTLEETRKKYLISI